MLTCHIYLKIPTDPALSKLSWQPVEFGTEACRSGSLLPGKVGRKRSLERSLERTVELTG